VIRLVTDTGSTFPPGVVEEFRISIVSGYLVFGEEVLSSYSGITPEDFYQRLAKSKELPLSRDPGVKDFKDVYADVLAESPGATILSIHVSESLATTVTAARQAAAMFPTARIVLFDTESVSFGQGLMVWEAARMIRDGATIEAILHRLRDMRQRLEIYFLVETLDYLARGGRIGPVSRLAGGLLDMKPILTVKHGLVQSHARYRSLERAQVELQQLAVSGCAGRKGVRMGVMHAMSLANAQELAGDLKRKVSPDVLAVAEIGPAVGRHTGPGTLAVCWYYPPEGTPASSAS
jgi:DegV family protein with EDD domain